MKKNERGIIKKHMKLLQEILEQFLPLFLKTSFSISRIQKESCKTSPGISDICQKYFISWTITTRIINCISFSTIFLRNIVSKSLSADQYVLDGETWNNSGLIKKSCAHRTNIRFKDCRNFAPSLLTHLLVSMCLLYWVESL